MDIDDNKGTLEIVWHDVFDLNVSVYLKGLRRGMPKLSQDNPHATSSSSSVALC